MIISPEFSFKDLEIILLDKVDSTNVYAKSHQFNKDALIISDYQTAGKGRFNRSFYSPKGKGVYFSLVLHDLDLSAQLYTILMALAISEQILNSQIKWLNDIMLNHKKVCGILAESQLSGNHFSKMIIGCGINLFKTQVPPELESIMTFVNQDDLDANYFLKKILKRFYELLHLDRATVIQLYKEKCQTLGQWIKINQQSVYAYDIDLEGHLLCYDQDNHNYAFYSGEVSSHA